MDHFQYQGHELYAERIPVKDLAAQFGTPAYIYSRATLERHWKAFDNALQGHPHLICYAVKANSNIAVLNILARLGSGFDIVSGGELDRVLAAGGDPAKVVFSGVGKQAWEIQKALEVGVHCFNVESIPELDRINEVAAKMNKIAPISLRINPDVDAQTHPYISTGLKENKFGVASEDAIATYQRAASMSHLRVKGIDCHIGSQLTQVRPFLDALERVLAMIDELANQGIQIEHLDIGGGLGVRYKDEAPPEPDAYATAILEKLGDRNLKLVMEPGRAIAANAGILITQVEFLKNTGDKHFIVVDGAMNDLIRPALYQAWQEIIPVNKRQDDTPNIQGDVVGPICETGDYLGKQRDLKVAPGDLLAVRSSGAYGFVMSSNYNSRNRPPEIMVDGDQAYVIRQRETFADQIKLETLIP